MQRDDDVRTGGWIIGPFPRLLLVDGRHSTAPTLQLCGHGGDPQLAAAIHRSLPPALLARNLQQHLRLPLPSTRVVPRSTTARVPTGSYREPAFDSRVAMCRDPVDIFFVGR